MKYWMVKAVLLGALVMLGLSVAFMFLWNWLVPSLFDGPLISLWQALGLLILAKLLFGRGGRWGGRQYGRQRRAWKKKFEEKWNQMTPEEKERFKQHFTHRCRHWRWSEQKDEQPTKSDKATI